MPPVYKEENRHIHVTMNMPQNFFAYFVQGTFTNISVTDKTSYSHRDLASIRPSPQSLFSFFPTLLLRAEESSHLQLF